MVNPIFLSTFWDVFWAVLITWFIMIPLLMLWVFALADLFRRRDIRLSKVPWLMFIIVIPVLGSIIYLLVRPEAADIPPVNPPM
jgi:hypothetical protein